jgi:putative FmdB family regulatory protein
MLDLRAMPTYQFQCISCEHLFEVIQSINDESVPTCPQCQGEAKKIFGGIGVLFKGPGFYKTDSRPKPKESPSSD